MISPSKLSPTLFQRPIFRLGRVQIREYARKKRSPATITWSALPYLRDARLEGTITNPSHSNRCQSCGAFSLDDEPLDAAATFTSSLNVLPSRGEEEEEGKYVLYPAACSRVRHFVTVALRRFRSFLRKRDRP